MSTTKQTNPSHTKFLRWLSPIIHHYPRITNSSNPLEPRVTLSLARKPNYYVEYGSRPPPPHNLRNNLVQLFTWPSNPQQPIISSLPMHPLQPTIHQTHDRRPEPTKVALEQFLLAFLLRFRCASLMRMGVSAPFSAKFLFSRHLTQIRGKAGSLCSGTMGKQEEAVASSPSPPATSSRRLSPARRGSRSAR